MNIFIKELKLLYETCMLNIYVHVYDFQNML